MSSLKAKICTERLSLDVIRDEDFSDLISILKHDEVSKYYMVPDFKSSEDERKLFTMLSDLSLRADRYVYGIFLDGKLIGIVNDTDMSGNMIEIGYALNPGCFGKGYMTEALSALIDHLLSHGFYEVTAGAFSENLASIRVMQKCGMVKIDKTEDITYRGITNTCVFYSVNKDIYLK